MRGLVGDLRGPVHTRRVTVEEAVEKIAVEPTVEERLKAIEAKLDRLLTGA